MRYFALLVLAAFPEGRDGAELFRLLSLGRFHGRRFGAAGLALQKQGRQRPWPPAAERGGKLTLFPNETRRLTYDTSGDF